MALEINRTNKYYKGDVSVTLTNEKQSKTFQLKNMSISNFETGTSSISFSNNSGIWLMDDSRFTDFQFTYRDSSPSKIVSYDLSNNDITVVDLNNYYSSVGFYTKSAIAPFYFNETFNVSVSGWKVDNDVCRVAAIICYVPKE